MIRRKSKLPVRLVSLALLSVCAGGCAQHYGGNTFPVHIEPESTDAKPIYLIPDQVWQTYQDDFSPKVPVGELNERLLEYRVKSDKTKVVDAKTYDVVTRGPAGLVVIDRITPSRPNEPFDFTKELSSAGTVGTKP